MKKIAIIALIIMAFSNALPAMAQPNIYVPPKDNATVLPSPTGSYQGALTQQEFLKTTAVNILNLVSNFFIGLAVFFLVIAGLEYILARGDEEMIKKSHQAALWAVIGVVVVMFAYTIIAIVNTLL